MAEILLSLTIIGVVAAITLPSLTGNINERTWNTQRKALYARMSQAISLMPALNGYGTLTEGNDSTSAVDNAAETFVTAGLSKVLKINNICDSDHLEDCGIATNITTLNGQIINEFTSTYNTLANFNDLFAATTSDSYSQLDTKAAAFETQNGESIIVFYNPNCTSNMQEQSSYYSQSKMCANFVYDLNGNKGPNSVGKDIGFISVLYPSDPVVISPIPLNKTSGSNIVVTTAIQLCKATDSESRLPSLEELASMFYNKLLLGTNTGTFWSGTRVPNDPNRFNWRLNFTNGQIGPTPGTGGSPIVWCIKR